MTSAIRGSSRVAWAPTDTAEARRIHAPTARAIRATIRSELASVLCSPGTKVSQKSTLRRGRSRPAGRPRQAARALTQTDGGPRRPPETESHDDDEREHDPRGSDHPHRSPLGPRAAPGPDPAHRRSGGPAGGRLPLLQRGGPLGALQRRRHHEVRGDGLPHHGARHLLGHGPAPLHDRRGHLRPPRHHRRLLQRREQRAAVRRQGHAELPRRTSWTRSPRSASARRTSSPT